MQGSEASAQSLSISNPQATLLRIVERATEALSRQRYDRSETFLLEGIVQFPDAATLHSLLDLVRTERKERRIALIDAALNTYFDDPRASCRAWSQLLEISPGDLEAERAIDDLSTGLLQYVDAWEQMAENHLMKGEFNDAADLALQIGSSGCAPARSVTLMTTVRERARLRHSEDLAFFTRLLKADRCNDLASRIPYFVEDSSVSNPQKAKALTLEGLCLHQVGDTAETVRRFEQALDLYPDVELPEWSAPQLVRVLGSLRSLRASTDETNKFARTPNR